MRHAYMQLLMNANWCSRPRRLVRGAGGESDISQTQALSWSLFKTATGKRAGRKNGGWRQQQARISLCRQIWKLS